jgi:hypothetical protein
VASRWPPVAKSSGKGRVASPPRGVPFWLVRSILGLVLVVAGALKLYELAFEAQDESAPTTLLMVFAEAEVLGGVWMVVGVDPIRTRRWALAAFVGLAIASLFQALAGKCSCGCFGTFSVNPWLVLVFDLTAVGALLGSRPRGDLDALFPSHPMYWLALGTGALIVAVEGWQQADLVTVAGKVTADGHPLESATLTFIGESGKILLLTEQSGRFRLPHVRPGLYAMSVPERMITPPTSSEKARRNLAKNATQRSRKQPSPPRPAPSNGSLLWIDIPRCSVYDKLVEL